MPKSIEYEGQLNLFDKQPTIKDEQPNLDNVVISHGRNFRIEISYLLEHLPQYNNYLKKEWTKDLGNDNLLLRTMFGGIENSLGTPPEIFDGLNALEICLMEAGIFKRKYLYFDDMVISSKGDIHQEPIIVKRDPALHTKESRIKTEGHLDGKSLYEIIIHLLTATGIERIYNGYKKDWQTIFQLKNPQKKQKRFKRLNPYDTLRLKERMDYIERKYQDVLWKFKKVLAEPFIPERIVKIDRYGNTKVVKHPEGFVTPGKTYKRGIHGKSFYRLREYAEKIHNYFQRKEKNIQK